MELLEDPVFKTKYQKHKMRVKLWESDFMEMYGRKPNKTDIKEADVTIRESYKMYWKLKTSALEQTLTDITFYDEEPKTMEKSVLDSPVSQNSKNTDENINPKITSSPKKDDLKNVKGVWGEHLSRENSTKNQTRLVGKSSSFQLSQKMFQTASFAKRNPRKSLSMNKSKLNEKSEEPEKEKIIEKEETSKKVEEMDKKEEEIESFFDKDIQISNVQEKSKIRTQFGGVLSLLEGQKNLRALDLGWIKRCSSDSQWTDSGLGSVCDNLNDTNKPPSKISDEEDFVCNSDSEEERRKKRIRNLKKRFSDSDCQANKRLCVEGSLNVVSSYSQPLPVTTETKTAIITKNVTKTIEIVNQNNKKKRKIVKEKEEKEQIVKKNSKRKAVTKSAPKTRRTRQSRKNNDTESEPEPELESEQVVHEPIYGVENVDVVPRLVLRSSGTGDLINDFSCVLGKSQPELSKSVSHKKLTDKEILEKKMADGKANDNFVRLNLKKKIYVRGKKNFSLSRYKKSQWKQRKKQLSSSEAALDAADLAEKNGTTCFKCGESGHFARRCPAAKGEDLLPLEDDYEEPSKYPTLEEAEHMARQSSQATFSQVAPRNLTENDNWDDWDGQDSKPVSTYCKVPEHLVAKLLPPEKSEVPSLYPTNPDSSIIDTPSEVFEALRKFGHDEFRPGQEKAVMRILSGLSTLVTLSTGSGKSLCYQLPAYLYAKRSACITLVVSPLVSLMDDQVTGIPAFLSAACLHTNQSEKVRAKIMESVKSGQLDVLLVSPEAVVAGEKSTGFGALFRQLPPIAFACIDEAHCISQWSHNFRPSYLMLCRVLKEKLRVKTVLGLTATATKPTATSIIEYLGVPDAEAGIITDKPLPTNLKLTVSRDENRDQAIVQLIRSPRFDKCDSIIVYCTRREECARIAGLLRVSLQDPRNHEGNVKVSKIAEVYHAGLSAYRRKTVQKSFMSGQTRIVVATVAFGMGINKSDIRAVIHYNLPGSFERYVQEIGRAGRDGLPAECHLFLDSNEESDKCELRRHIFANSVDRYTVRKLLQRVFVPCSCLSAIQKSTGQRCPGHEVAIPIDETVQALDITEETISTLLCYLELHPKRFIKVLSSVYVKANVSSYGGAKALKMAAQSSPPLAMAIALNMKNGTFTGKEPRIEFSVVDIASAIGWDSGIVKSHLKSLEWVTVNGKTKRSPITVRFDTLGLRVRAPGDLSEDESEMALQSLADRSQSQEMLNLAQLETVCIAVRDCSVTTVRECFETDNEVVVQHCNELRQRIQKYFAEENPAVDIMMPQNETLENESQIVNDIRALLYSYRDTNFTGRAVARIFHGIQSPNYSALIWARCRFWRAHLRTDFNLLCKIAIREIIAMR